LLIAQSNALLRNGQGWEATPVTIPGVLHIDTLAHRIRMFDQELVISRGIFFLFHYLALHPDRTFSAAEIASQLVSTAVRENAVAAQVYRLRSVLKGVGAESWLVTVHAVGYRLTLPDSKYHNFVMQI
jgi:two-component system phosphate regulon response regulator PhoB